MILNDRLIGPSGCQGLKDEGMTLIEVMIALFVFTVGILAVAQLQISALNCQARAARTMYDSVSAGVQLEAILSWEYHDPRLEDTDNGFFPDQPDYGPYPLAVTNSTVEWEVDDNYKDSGVKRISVTIRWWAGGAKPMKVIYEYLKSDRFS